MLSNYVKCKIVSVWNIKVNCMFQRCYCWRYKFCLVNWRWHYFMRNAMLGKSTLSRFCCRRNSLIKWSFIIFHAKYIWKKQIKYDKEQFNLAKGHISHKVMFHEKESNQITVFKFSDQNRRIISQKTLLGY